MTTDERIVQCYKDLKASIERENTMLSPHTNNVIKINKQYMLGKFELWMFEDLERLDLINNTK